MKNIKLLIVVLLGVLLYSCASDPLKKYRKCEINIDMLDTISNNQVGEYKETVEETYLFGFIRLNIYRGGLEHVPISPALRTFSSGQVLYDKGMMRLLVNPKISKEVNSKYLGIYKHKKTTLKGISINNLSEERIIELAENK